VVLAAVPPVDGLACAAAPPPDAPAALAPPALLPALAGIAPKAIIVVTPTRMENGFLNKCFFIIRLSPDLNSD
jgi:hypothetical protein